MIRSAIFTKNTFFKYTLLAEVPPAVATADVTINGQYGQRTENIIHRNMTVNNATTGVLAANSVVRGGTTPETITGNTWVPRNVVVPTYDFDGNLTKDGLWTYTWDAENRLVSMAMDGNAGYATRIKLDFLYDSENRRVSKAVSTTTSQVVSPTWTLQSTTRFLYDGWNMIAQYSFAANLFTVHAQYVWGLDVNGAMQSAGGVGGLLQAKVIDTATSTTTQCLPCYDGNGNITAWVDGANSALIERREYDSFGSMVSIYRLATNATLHGRLAYGFSTKWRDAESDLLYYGHRYYNPSTQRWLNRDLIEEAGGINLYGFVGNDGVNRWDLLGMVEIEFRSNYKNKTKDQIWSELNSPSPIAYGIDPDYDSSRDSKPNPFRDISGYEKGLINSPVDPRYGIKTPDTGGETRAGALGLIYSEGCFVKGSLTYMLNYLWMNTDTNRKPKYHEYWDVAHHEVMHVIAMHNRLNSIIEIFKTMPDEYETTEEARDVARALNNLLQALIDHHDRDEGDHNTFGGFGTPAAGETIPGWTHKP